MWLGAILLSGICLLLARYWGVTDPFNHNVEVMSIPPSWWSELPILEGGVPLNDLQRYEVSFLKEVQGPESLAFDSKGRGPYTGVADGRVVFWNGEAWTDFAYTSSNRSDCKPQASMEGYVKKEHICGRPLGLRFHKRTGDLYIADAYFGLLKVGPKGGLATSLSTEAEGVRTMFTNDLDVVDDGTVYFTDSSTKYQRRNFTQVCLSGDNSGRILKYDPITKQTTVLMKGLQFPNGITLAKDGNSLIYAEGCPGKLGRYWLKGEKKKAAGGTSELFAVLPGYPDNVRTNDNGEYWVALPYSRPRSSAVWQKQQYYYSSVAKYGDDGKMVLLLEDREGKVVRAVSQVNENEKDGQLWLGSILLNFIAVYDLNSSTSYPITVVINNSNNNNLIII